MGFNIFGQQALFWYFMDNVDIYMLFWIWYKLFLIFKYPVWKIFKGATRVAYGQNDYHFCVIFYDLKGINDESDKGSHLLSYY